MGLTEGSSSATEAGDHLLSSGEFNSSPLRLVTPSPVPAYSSSARSADITALHRPPPRHLSPLLPAPLRLPVPTTLGPHQDHTRTYKDCPWHLFICRSPASLSPSWAVQSYYNTHHCFSRAYLRPFQLAKPKPH